MSYEELLERLKTLDEMVSQLVQEVNDLTEENISLQKEISALKPYKVIVSGEVVAEYATRAEMEADGWE